MKSKKLAGGRVSAAAQKYLDIAEIRDDVVVLKDGTMRTVLLVSSINFALKSEEEQNATIAGYVSFLNSFQHPLQIVIQSRKLNIDKYLVELEEKERVQTNELLKAQTKDYISFVRELVDLGEIMTKKFYVIVPYDPITDKQKGFWARFKELFSVASVIKLSEKRFIERKNELGRRVELIQAGLSSMGLNSVQLNTQSLIELYYGAYNPVISQSEKLPPLEKIRVEA